MVMVLGKASIIFTTLGILVTMCVVFAMAIVIVELAHHASGSARAIFVKVSRTLVRNPILIASAVALPFPCSVGQSQHQQGPSPTCWAPRHPPVRLSRSVYFLLNQGLDLVPEGPSSRSSFWGSSQSILCWPG
jgi:hypothetical protein